MWRNRKKRKVTTAAQLKTNTDKYCTIDVAVYTIPVYYGITGNKRSAGSIVDIWIAEVNDGVGNEIVLKVKGDKYTKLEILDLLLAESYDVFEKYLEQQANP